MSGWAVYRRQLSTAVFGGVIGFTNLASVPGSGWLVVRRQPSTAVWGGIAAVSNIAPVPPAAAAALSGFQDRRPGYLKKRVLFGV